MIGPHLTPENHLEVLGRAKFRTKKELGKLVRELNPLPGVPDCIEPLGLTITKAAEALGVTRTTLSELVHGKRGISPEMASKATFMKGRGCNHCHQSGYKGRLGIYEMMLMTSKIRELAFEGAPTQVIRRTAINLGMTTLYSDGISKVLKGVTTLEEIFRVAKQVEQ
jgi:predicted transcriptional regulator